MKRYILSLMLTLISSSAQGMAALRHVEQPRITRSLQRIIPLLSRTTSTQSHLQDQIDHQQNLIARLYEESRLLKSFSLGAATVATSSALAGILLPIVVPRGSEVIALEIVCAGSGGFLAGSTVALVEILRAWRKFTQATKEEKYLLDVLMKIAEDVKARKS